MREENDKLIAFGHFLGVSIFIILGFSVYMLLYGEGDKERAEIPFYKMDRMVKIADKARKKDNVVMNERTIKEITDISYEKNSIIKGKSNLNHKFVVLNNKLHLSGNVSYQYYEKMLMTYESQLLDFSDKFNFNSPCKKDKLENCFFEISEK